MKRKLSKAYGKPRMVNEVAAIGQFEGLISGLVFKWGACGPSHAW